MIDVKKTVHSMFNEMRADVKSPNTGPKIRVAGDANDINSVIDQMEGQVDTDTASLGVRNGRIEK